MILHFFYFFLNLCDFGTFFPHFLLIFELALIVVLNNLQFFQSFCQNLILVEVGIHLLPDALIILLQLLQFLHHLLVHVLLDSWQQALLASV